MTLPHVSGYQKGQQFPLWHKADISMQARVCPLLGADMRCRLALMACAAFDP
jgi:hypothetical protein